MLVAASKPESQERLSYEDLLDAWSLLVAEDRIEEFRGRISGKAIPGTADVDRRHKVVAVIDPAQCSGCGLCRKVCLFSAPEKDGKTFRVLTPRCDGCGLCPELCPKGAIRLVPGTGRPVTQIGKNITVVSGRILVPHIIKKTLQDSGNNSIAELFFFC